MKTFKEMMFRAKNKDYFRDKKRSEAVNMQKKYIVTSFPAYHGAPIANNFFLIAFIIKIWRSFLYAETKIEKVGK